MLGTTAQPTTVAATSSLAGAANSRRARFARGWIGATVTTGFAASSHVLGGGSAPPILLVLFSLSISALICIALAGKALSWARMLAAVVLSQGLFHALFALSGPSGAHGVDLQTGGGHAGHLLHQALFHSTLSSSTPPSSASGAGQASCGAAMLIFHVAAAIATVLILRHGEVAALTLLRLLRLSFRALHSVPLPSALPRIPLRTYSPFGIFPVVRLLGLTRSWRGPPSPASA